jgi:isoquinoline 1-oxidoreductase beta subunit
VSGLPFPSRRAFLLSATAAGGTLALGFDIPFGAAATEASPAAQEITAWIVIARDDSVTIRVARSEMGQGILTALPMLLAEELECDWSKVRAEFVAPQDNLRRQRAWGDMSTGGSRSIRASHEALRRAGATAREMLIAAAAAAWDVPPAECRAARSVISHPPSGRKVSFGQIAAAAARVEPPRIVALKHPKDWTLAGKPTRRLDVIAKVQGKPIYGIDVRLPGMLYAAVVQPPVFGGRLKSVDETKLAGLRGIHKVVKLDHAVAVIADSWWRAKTAVEALAVVWDDGGNGTVTSESIGAFLHTGLFAPKAGVGRKEGDVAQGLAQAATRVEAEYAVPFLAHATLEPQNCTAHVSGGKVEIWVPTQNGEASLASAAAAAGVSPGNVTVHKCMLGGGFGRRGVVQDFVALAVKIAKEVDRPVKVLWTREQDTRHDFYRPVAMARMTAGLDSAGMPLAWHVRMTGHSVLGSLQPMAIRSGLDRHFQEGFLQDMPYDVPNYLADYAIRMTHVPVGFWRCVNHTQNCFFKESFIDELAHAGRQDPYEYRRKLIGRHLHAKRLTALLDAVAGKSAWGTPLPDGIHRGIALHEAYGTHTAAVIEASVDRKGELRVHRVICAIDCGHVVNPLTVEMQVESSVVFALTAALYGEITLKDGHVEQSNFHDYRMLRMREMPRVETIVMPSGGFWSGVGEPPVALVAPALCNAIFAATGKRIRSLPLKNHDLMKA